MNCRKNLKRPKVTDCVNCEYEDVCKFESIIRGAKDIENIHSENTNGVIDRYEEANIKLEKKLGPHLYGIVSLMLGFFIFGIIVAILSWITDLLG